MNGVGSETQSIIRIAVHSCRFDKSAKLLLLSFLLAVAVMNASARDPHPARMIVARTAFSSFQVALDFFRNDCGRYPTTQEGLAALVKRPENIPPDRWHQYSSGIDKDSWGRDYVYHCPGAHNTNGYDLYSLGPDGITKTDGADPDDINNWDRSSPHFIKPDPPSHAAAVTLTLEFGVFLLLAFAVWWGRHTSLSTGNWHGVAALLYVTAAIPLINVVLPLLPGTFFRAWLVLGWWLPALPFAVSGLHRGGSANRLSAAIALVIAFIFECSMLMPRVTG